MNLLYLYIILKIKTMKETEETYVLSHYGEVVGVIIAENEGELLARTAGAVQDNIEADEDGQFSIEKGVLGDFGEGTFIKVMYVNEGELIIDDEFNLTKTVSYK